MQRPDFFAGTLQEAKWPGRGGSEADGPHQVIAQGEFDRTVKSDFTTAPNPTLFWRGPVIRVCNFPDFSFPGKREKLENPGNFPGISREIPLIFCSREFSRENPWFPGNSRPGKSREQTLISGIQYLPFSWYISHLNDTSQTTTLSPFLLTKRSEEKGGRVCLTGLYQENGICIRIN